jgi:hypothetical protein
MAMNAPSQPPKLPKFAPKRIPPERDTLDDLEVDKNDRETIGKALKELLGRYRTATNFGKDDPKRSDPKQAEKVYAQGLLLFLPQGSKSHAIMTTEMFKENSSQRTCPWDPKSADVLRANHFDVQKEYDIEKASKASSAHAEIAVLYDLNEKLETAAKFAPSQVVMVFLTTEVPCNACKGRIINALSDFKDKHPQIRAVALSIYPGFQGSGSAFRVKLGPDMSGWALLFTPVRNRAVPNTAVPK